MSIWKKIWQYFCANTAADSELMSAFRETADREFSLYLENLLQEEKETIVGRTGETWFYTCIYDYVMSCDSINEMILEEVTTETPIGKMWDYCQKQELTVSEWEDVDLIMEETFLHQKPELKTAS